MLSTFFSFNGVQLLQLTVQASDVNIMCWGKLRVLSDIVSFSYSRVVNRFASCVGAEWYAHLIDLLLAGTRNQGIYRFPLSQLNPVCNILNCSLTDFVLPNLTLERTFSELEVVFQMCVLQQAHQYPCDEDAVCGMKPIQKLCQDSLQSICPSPDYGLWTAPSQAFPSDLTIPHADVFCAGCCLFLFFDFFFWCLCAHSCYKLVYFSHATFGKVPDSWSALSICCWWYLGLSSLSLWRFRIPHMEIHLICVSACYVYIFLTELGFCLTVMWKDWKKAPALCATFWLVNDVWRQPK